MKLPPYLTGNTKFINLKIMLLLQAFIIILYSCQNNKSGTDAYGNFEAVSVMVSPESSGRLLLMNATEGQFIDKGTDIALIDTIPLVLKKNQIRASVKALKNQLQNPAPQIELIRKQITILEKEKERVNALLADNAATRKQFDDIQGQIDIMTQQAETLKQQATIANQAILSQLYPLESQIMLIDDQIARCHVKNPVSGTVLLRLAETGELVSPARPLYTIANLDTMELRAYISESQLPHLKIGQKVKVMIDKDKKNDTPLSGTVSWISSKAEFTPRTIQTKEERVSQVYAFKVRVANPEGRLKIGMPGEVIFDPQASTRDQ